MWCKLRWRKDQLWLPRRIFRSQVSVLLLRIFWKTWSSRSESFTIILKQALWNVFFFLGDYCKPCQCSGNIDPREPGSCDTVTGNCLKCLNNTYGTACALCAPGYYGDAVTLKDCQGKYKYYMNVFFLRLSQKIIQNSWEAIFPDFNFVCYLIKILSFFGFLVT